MVEVSNYHADSNLATLIEAPKEVHEKVTSYKLQATSYKATIYKLQASRLQATSCKVTSYLPAICSLLLAARTS